MQRSLIHVLLSLLLLLSQQLSLGHGYTHWSEISAGFGEAAVTQAVVDDDGTTKVPKPVLHDLCGQCAASAQFAFALPSLLRTFVPAELSYAAPVSADTPGICLLADCPFQPRAPPRA